MKKFQAGIVIPWVNTAMEEEITEFVHPNVGVHWTRVRPEKLPKDGHDSSYLKSMMASIPMALSRFDGLKLDIIVIGCTSISFTNTSTLEIPQKYNHTPVVSVFDLIMLQLQKMGIKTLLLFAPYDRSTIDCQISIFNKNKITVLKAIPLHYKEEIRYITIDDIFDNFAAEFPIQDCDAVFFSCTALYTFEVFKKIKTTFDIKIPILSSNSVIVDAINNWCRLKK